MIKKFKIDIISDDPVHNEFVLHLVERSPWHISDLATRLRAIQERLYDAVDLVIDGHLAHRYPESKGRNLRIQLDCYDEPPEVRRLVLQFQAHMESDPEYQRSIKKNAFAKNLRIISVGSAMQ